jgi:hypothetical protein
LSSSGDPLGLGVVPNQRGSGLRIPLLTGSFFILGRILLVLVKDRPIKTDKTRRKDTVKNLPLDGAFFARRLISDAVADGLFLYAAL